MFASSNFPLVSVNAWTWNYLFDSSCALDGFDVKQMKINGRFSYDRSSQRDLEFFTEIREIDLHRRIFVEDESELQTKCQTASSCGCLCK